MVTLSYGYKRPETGKDKGNVFFPALEDNITRLNSHNHDGSNSSLLTIKAIKATKATLSNTAWDAVDTSQDGTFRQTVTMPTGISFDDSIVSFKNSSGDQLFLSVEKVSTSQYRVYINDSSADLTAYYGQ